MMSGYVVAKWGARGLTKTAALEPGAANIRVMRCIRTRPR